MYLKCLTSLTSDFEPVVVDSIMLCNVSKKWKNYFSHKGQKDEFSALSAEHVL